MYFPQEHILTLKDVLVGHGQCGSRATSTTAVTTAALKEATLIPWVPPPPTAAGAPSLRKATQQQLRVIASMF
jgi:hypothetical protein